MNTVLTYLADHWARLALEPFGAPAGLSCVIDTPRFRTSRNVVFLILAEGFSEPILVAKMARLPGDGAALDREALNLRAVQASRPGGFASIPCVVACGDYADSRILVESALVGRSMNPALVRRQPAQCLEEVTGWLLELHSATACRREAPEGWFERLAARPLAWLERALPLAPEERRLIERTRTLTAALRGREIPLVFEHGDLSAPNILLNVDGAAVLDWELAEPRGLPAVDLFFFLTFVASSRRRAKTVGDHLGAFREAFFGPKAWAQPYLERYAEGLRLPREFLGPLFVLCWSRYVSQRRARLGSMSADAASPVEKETAAWLRGDPYYALWHYAVDHVDELNVGKQVDGLPEGSRVSQRGLMP